MSRSCTRELADSFCLMKFPMMYITVVTQFKALYFKFLLRHAALVRFRIGTELSASMLIDNRLVGINLE